MLSLIHVLEWRAAVSRDRTALTDGRGGAGLTFGALAGAADRAAAGYAAAGVRPGDVVPVIARNRAGWAVAFLGLVRAGALPAAVNWRLAAPELRGLLELIGPTAIVTDEACAALVGEALAGTEPAGTESAGTRPAGTAPTGGAGARVPVLRLEDPLPEGPMPERPAERLRGPEPCVLLHTSGTTGLPKLVPVTHQQLIGAVTFMKLEVPEAVPGARHLSALPLFHTAGLANLVYTLFTGGHLHVLDGFDPAAFVDDLAARRIQLTQLVPTLIRAVTEEVGRRAAPPDLSDLVEVVYGASPIDPGLLGRAVRTLGCRFRQNYAATETGPLPITTLPPADHDPAAGRLASAGRPSLGWEVRLGEHGEVQVRGAAPFPGYWNDPDATAAVTTGDGFHRTGDIGAIDADGYLTIVDRLKDMIVTGGENVYPAEVEAVLAAHPGVREAAVFGVPHERWGETVHAVVAGEDGLDAAELTAWARERLAGFKCPTALTFAPELPRNATGKVVKSVLRERHWAGRERRVS
ncbi:class I adenylate-forming enzyme family protein [Actinomadura xylanilytica]|uniref:class I adenylate-forming enzyme family protein n=1 Tax=Actinomadura xylanilytica TaxID=887459 RepID=UPI00255B224C|nr:AMP-binding protein [Actinomadura xylanilytica]MDL4777070.1 AMP-binding protein [Actinomadura xylanilytica]